MGQEARFLDRLNSEDSAAYRLTPDADKLAHSVLSHLVRLLNTRQGSSATQPDYGLPDFNDLVTRFPDAINELKREIKRQVEKYEPRLIRVRVNHVADKDQPLSLRFEITAQLLLGEGTADVWFETMLDAAGRVRLRG